MNYLTLKIAENIRISILSLIFILLVIVFRWVESKFSQKDQKKENNNNNTNH